jgi:hypothetical protein
VFFAISISISTLAPLKSRGSGSLHCQITLPPGSLEPLVRRVRTRRRDHGLFREWQSPVGKSSKRRPLAGRFVHAQLRQLRHPQTRFQREAIPSSGKTLIPFHISYCDEQQLTWTQLLHSVSHTPDHPPHTSIMASTGVIPVANETNSSSSRITKEGKKITYCMKVIQQPERARACGSGAKCKLANAPKQIRDAPSDCIQRRPTADQLIPHRL